VFGGPEAIDLGAGRVSAWGFPGLDRRATARAWSTVGGGPEAGRARRVDRRRAALLAGADGRSDERARRLGDVVGVDPGRGEQLGRLSRARHLSHGQADDVRGELPGV